ncbi:MAG: hypothetical protein QGH73_04550 [Rhodospirillales bacterium]|jgi:hypothetical protein|nr:hypothetical protein [Rhodospirillaceae bacterium]MDP6427147.1 hypothetical protein [Rhodospirillales bacterium]MDP6646663.1 hypothetical protein [Rhodospirillales bacterium]MDP6840926.1 hypothetical protein [Rhodospirillales bacterium]|tara:strand:- start:765 stop:1388 length:624 start_codon:yes stop_codon:yes gene_type:complete
MKPILARNRNTEKGIFLAANSESQRLVKGLGKVFWCTALFALALAPVPAPAAPPDLQTPEPVIYLADNLDEQDRLGYCIDTVGRGLSDRLHAHSCKPHGGDVQFYYNRASRQIVSATYSGKCATLNASAAVGVSLGLVDCSVASSGQMFDYNSETLAFRPGGDHSLCLAVGVTSRTAGPFMSRNLELAPCGSTDARYRQWRIKGGKT